MEFDDSTDYHAFAMEPIVDNVQLVHHIDMYECPNEQGKTNMYIERVHDTNTYFKLYLLLSRLRACELCEANSVQCDGGVRRQHAGSVGAGH